jgi:hypothetical protein
MAMAVLIKMITTMVRVSFCEHFLVPSRSTYSLMLILMRKASHVRIRTIIIGVVNVWIQLE